MSIFCGDQLLLALLLLAFTISTTMAFQFYTDPNPTLLDVTGDDAFDYLQSQISNDLQSLSTTQPTLYTLLLTRKGKVLADAFITEIAENHYRLHSYFTSAETLVEILSQNIIADDVELIPLEKYVSITLIGAPMPTATENSWVFPGRRSSGENYTLIVPEGEIQSCIPAGGTPISADVLHALRVSSATPAVPEDIGPSDLPHEGSLELSAVSFTKGCYLGQETMARLQNSGQVRRRLILIELLEGSLSPGQDILNEQGRAIAQVRSQAGNQYLALFKERYLVDIQNNHTITLPSLKIKLLSTDHLTL